MYASNAEEACFGGVCEDQWCLCIVYIWTKYATSTDTNTTFRLCILQHLAILDGSIYR